MVLLTALLPHLDLGGISMETTDVDNVLQQIIEVNSLKLWSALLYNPRRRPVFPVFREAKKGRFTNFVVKEENNPECFSIYTNTLVVSEKKICTVVLNAVCLVLVCFKKLRREPSCLPDRSFTFNLKCSHKLKITWCVSCCRYLFCFCLYWYI